MATKAEERKALKQIKGIVEGLGADSYIATAFTGVWALAEDNINLDFAYSTQYYIDKYHNSQNEIRQAKEESAKENRTLKLNLESAEKDVQYWKESEENYRKEYVNTCTKVDEANRALKAEQERAEALEAEIIKLKAKLFDLLYAEK